MRKKGILVWGILLLLINISLVYSLEISATNINLKQNYTLGEILSGNFSLKVTDISPDYVLKTNLGHSIPLREFLSNNGEQLDCESFGCEDRYTSNSQAFESKIFSLSSGSQKIFGIMLNGNNVQLSDIQLVTKLNFDEQSQIPLKIKFGGDGELKFVNESNNFNRYSVSGVQSLISTDYKKNIDSTPYCQKLSLIPTKKVMIGANFSGTSMDEVRMELRNSRNDVLGSCIFIAQGNKSCVVEMENEIVSEEYFVCLSTESTEDSGLKLGFKSSSNGKGYYGGIYGTSEGDYSIFARIPYYLAANNLEINLIGDNEKTNLLNKMSSYLLNNYKSLSSNRINCSEGCFIPLAFEGIQQEVEITSVSLSYVSNSGSETTTSLYELTVLPSKGNFEGFVEIDSSEFKLSFSGKEKVEFYLEKDTEKNSLFDRMINIDSIPIVIRNIYPSFIPAGIPTLIFAEVLSGSPVISYRWTFGDGGSIETEENRVIKTYGNISTYNLTLRVLNNLSEHSEKTIFIDVINPRNYLNRTIEMKNTNLDNLESEIDSLAISQVYKEELKRFFGLDKAKEELDKIDAEKRSATADSKFMELAQRIQTIEIPQMVWVKTKIKDSFIINPRDIDLTVISSIVKKDFSDEKYKEYISNWQIANVVGTIDTSEIAMLDSNGIESKLATIYQIEVEAGGESYLIVQGGINVKSSIELQSTEKSKTLKLSPGEKKKFEMISLNGTVSAIYVSPDISKVDLTGKISPCNFNKICESNIGEDYKNCSSDCKPWPRVIIFLIVVLIISAVAYTFVQVQFKKKYELQLFGSEQELKNLIESIKNSNENNIPEKEITEKLIKNGWSKEQVSYAIKKSKGERTRPYEIIQMDRILNKFTNKTELNKDKTNELPKKTKK